MIQLAQLRSWLVYHTRDSRRSQPGFPDIVLVKGRLIFAELKSETGRLTPEQERWLAALRSAGCDVRVWRPSDWQEIEETLNG